MILSQSWAIIHCKVCVITFSVNFLCLTFEVVGHAFLTYEWWSSFIYNTGSKFVWFSPCFDCDPTIVIKGFHFQLKSLIYAFLEGTSICSLWSFWGIRFTLLFTCKHGCADVRTFLLIMSNRRLLIFGMGMIMFRHGALCIPFERVVLILPGLCSFSFGSKVILFDCVHYGWQTRIHVHIGSWRRLAHDLIYLHVDPYWSIPIYVWYHTHMLI